MEKVMENRRKLLVEPRKAKIRKWNDVYEAIRSDIEEGIIPTGSGSGKPTKNAYAKEEVDAMLADKIKAIKELQEAVKSLEETVSRLDNPAKQAAMASG